MKIKSHIKAKIAFSLLPIGSFSILSGAYFVNIPLIVFGVASFAVSFVFGYWWALSGVGDQ